MNKKLRKKREWARGQKEKLHEQLADCTRPQLVALSVQWEILSYESTVAKTREELRQAIFDNRLGPYEPVKA